ncbi:MAG: flavin reductase family protein [Anaerolineae bacterium]|nr:flavin reductase family protein [Anaerolineae bacterium]
MKVKLGTFPLVYPIPIVLAGAMVAGKPNYATLGDCGVMGIKPPLVYVSLNETHYTTQGILEHSTYSVNFPTTEMLAVTDYCGIVSGRDIDKAMLFESFYGELETAPMIAQCPVNLECRVVKEFTIQHRHIFIGEVVQAYVEATYLIEKEGQRGIADMTQLDPIIYALDNRYYRIGEAIGMGYQEGKIFKHTM